MTIRTHVRIMLAYMKADSYTTYRNMVANIGTDPLNTQTGNTMATTDTIREFVASAADAPTEMPPGVRVGVHTGRNDLAVTSEPELSYIQRRTITIEMARRSIEESRKARVASCEKSSLRRLSIIEIAKRVSRAVFGYQPSTTQGL